MYTTTFVLMIIATMMSGTIGQNFPGNCDSTSDCTVIKGTECEVFILTVGGENGYVKMCALPDACGTKVNIGNTILPIMAEVKCGFSAFWYLNSNWLTPVLIAIVLMIILFSIRMKRRK